MWGLNSKVARLQLFFRGADSLVLSRCSSHVTLSVDKYYLIKQTVSCVRRCSVSTDLLPSGQRCTLTAEVGLAAVHRCPAEPPCRAAVMRRQKIPAVFLLQSVTLLQRGGEHTRLAPLPANSDPAPERTTTISAVCQGDFNNQEVGIHRLHNKSTAFFSTENVYYILVVYIVYMKTI